MSHAARLTRRTILTGASASVLAGALPAYAAPAFKRGGHPQALGETQLPAFDLVEHTGVSSLGYKRVGLPIKQADVPPGYTVEIRYGGVAVPAQFDRRATWKWGSNVGSQQFMTACLRLPNFSASEARTYTVVSKPGSFNNVSSMTLATALAGTDFKVDFAAMTGSAAGAMPDHSASLNTHAAVATRVEKYESGPVCDSWKIWGMASSGGVDHAHLKTNWYFTVWKDAGGAIVDYEVAAVVAMDWWSIAGKEKLTYTATLKNGGTVIQAYGGSISSLGVRSATVEHVSQAQWATLRLQNDNENGTRHWINNPRPTLLYKPDRTYWIATGLVPPYDITTAYSASISTSYKTGASTTPGVYSAYTYQPGSAQGHRANIDGQGFYPGRGLLTEMDVVAFTTQTADNVRMMIVNATAALHIPEHYRSNNLRTRPGESADIANTIISLHMANELGAITDDFTAQGMPAPVYAYFGVLSAGRQDGYVTPTGGYTSGSSAWVPGGDSTHRVNYGYMAYLHSGERYYLEAMLDNMNHVLHPLNADASGAQGWTYGVALDGTTIYPGSPHVQWAAVGPRTQANSRHAAWGMKVMSDAVVTPDNDVQAGYVKQLIGLQARWLSVGAQYIPSDVQGVWEYEAGIGPSPWWETWMAQCWYNAYDKTADPTWLPFAEVIARIFIHPAEMDRMACIRNYHASTRRLMMSKMNLATNPNFDEFFMHDKCSSLVGSTGVFTYSPSNNLAGVTTQYQENDLFMMSALGETLAVYAFPAEIPEGTTYYMVNVTGTTFQIATTASGTPLTFTSNYANFIFAALSEAWRQVVPERTLVPDGNAGFVKASLAMAIRHNHPRLTPTLIAKFNTYFAGANYDYANNAGTVWNLTPTA